MANQRWIVPIYSLFRRLIEPLTGRSNSTFVMVILLLVVGLASYLGWLKFGPRILASAPYQLNVKQIHATPQPDWIALDVRKRAFRDGSLAGLSVTETRLTAKIKDAFELQPWVERVRSVRKRPGPRIEVEIDYRMPVAMVQVAPMQLLPIDRNGVVLVTDEEAFAGDPLQFIWILSNARWQGTWTAGHLWGDDGIHGAARVAGLLVENRQALGLRQILVDSRQANPIYTLVTKGDQARLWGHAPGKEVPGELTAEKKIDRLIDVGTLDKLKPTELFGLAESEGVSVAEKR